MSGSAYKMNFTNVMDSMTKRLFRIKKPDRYDITGIRDAQFLKRNVEPLFKPTEESMSWSFVPIINIIDLIYKGIGCEFESDKELKEIILILAAYLKEIDGFDVGALPKNSEEAIFMKKLNTCYFQLSKLNNYRTEVEESKHPEKNTIKNIFRSLSVFGG